MEKVFTSFLLLLTFTAMALFNGKNPLFGRQKTPGSQYDGPYVMYSHHKILVHYLAPENGIVSVHTDTIEPAEREKIALKVMTDVEGLNFYVPLKNQLRNEKSEYPKPPKLVALSDIEGNFAAFRKLLLATKVIDDNLNWIFGNGHLVLVGDFFDRGDQVTEILWLIYYLEQKSKAAGGYVHFILGNHEIMNLSGDLRYLNPKYETNAGKLGISYERLYSKDTELGRWLRTKNIVEKIGGIVFVHGGISTDINRIATTLPVLNKLSRPFYADSHYQNGDDRLSVIFSDNGPFWYRGYYSKEENDIPAQLNETLAQYGAYQVVTGHTIVADSISAWYEGKLLDTDVHHSHGKSEALLIEDKSYYRVNAEGDKVLIMVRN